MIAIVCGGRDYADQARVARVLDAAVTRMGLDTIIEGGATGADTLALEWAKARGDISWIHVPADWNRDGKSGGHIRNKLMLDILLGGDRDTRRYVIAFPGGDGTKGMVALGNSRAASKAGVKVVMA